MFVMDRKGAEEGMKKETSTQKELFIQKYRSKLVEFAVLRTDTCRCLVIYVAV